LRMNASAISRHDLNCVREFEADSSEVTVEKQKVLQILVNQICNAKQACDEAAVAGKVLMVRVTNCARRNGNFRVPKVFFDAG
jgi:nitrogen-specific signal transduction histidine kinase